MKLNQKHFRTTLKLISAALVTLSACQPKGGDFAGSGGRAAVVKPEEPKTEDQEKVDPPEPLPPSCTEAKLDSVRRLTSYVDQRLSAGSVTLELAFSPCPSQLNPVNLPILFDIDAHMYYPDSSDQRMTYEVWIDSTRVAGPGYLTSISGKDLFGKVGSNFIYFQSDRSLSVSPNITKAKLQIKFGGFGIAGPQTSDDPAESNFVVPIYVKIGQSSPVRVNVTFTPAPQPI